MTTHIARIHAQALLCYHTDDDRESHYKILIARIKAGTMDQWEKECKVETIVTTNKIVINLILFPNGTP